MGVGVGVGESATENGHAPWENAALVFCRCGTCFESSHVSCITVGRENRFSFHAHAHETDGPSGIWLLVNDREYLLPFETFPWFREATIAQIHHLTMHGQYLRWPDLDIDLELESLAHPERYPLKYREN